MNRQRPLSDYEFSDFIAVSTLLSLIDPVRGKPTANSLDIDPNDPAQRHDHLYTRFLDSFALICSTSRRGGETASAACLERYHAPATTILRVARNQGIPPDLLSRLQSILDKLKLVTVRGHALSQLEDSILYEVIDITKDKIRSLIERFDKNDVREAVDRLIRGINQRPAENGSDASTFKRWISNLPDLVSLAPDADPLTLAPYIKWASRARWYYSHQLESYLSSFSDEVPLWVKTIYKLGRYYAATHAMVKLASRQPDMFSTIRIETVQCPATQNFELKGKKGNKVLTSLLQKICRRDNYDHLVAELSRKCFRKSPEDPFLHDPEDFFRRKCKQKLTVHAEMQLLSFYDQKPELSPRLRFMGTSKKACYLCDSFLSRHPLRMSYSASHQKLYPTWMPPPCSRPSISMYRELLWNMKSDLEKAAARELQGELGHRRPANLDSTAGPPITFSNTFWTMHIAESLVSRNSIV